MKIIFQNSIIISKIFVKLSVSPPFIITTIIGNIIIVSFSLIIYFLEKKTNDTINSFIDALWWGFSTATTVGYGDIIPKTISGKITGIFLMLIGTALFAIYTGLVAQAILKSNIMYNKDDSKEKNLNP